MLQPPDIIKVYLLCIGTAHFSTRNNCQLLLFPAQMLRFHYSPHTTKTRSARIPNFTPEAFLHTAGNPPDILIQSISNRYPRSREGSLRCAGVGIWRFHAEYRTRVYNIMLGVLLSLSRFLVGVFVYVCWGVLYGVRQYFHPALSIFKPGNGYLREAMSMAIPETTLELIERFERNAKKSLRSENRETAARGDGSRQPAARSESGSDSPARASMRLWQETAPRIDKSRRYQQIRGGRKCADACVPVGLSLSVHSAGASTSRRLIVAPILWLVRVPAKELWLRGLGWRLREDRLSVPDKRRSHRSSPHRRSPVVCMNSWHMGRAGFHRDGDLSDVRGDSRVSDPMAPGWTPVAVAITSPRRPQVDLPTT